MQRKRNFGQCKNGGNENSPKFQDISLLLQPVVQLITSCTIGTLACWSPYKTFPKAFIEKSQMAKEVQNKRSKSKSKKCHMTKSYD